VLSWGVVFGVVGARKEPFGLLWLVLLGPLVVACSGRTTTRTSGGPEVQTSFASGARLRARVLDADGGATVFETWFDSELEQACSFLPAEDGFLRCLPWDAALATHFTATDGAYLDAACSEAVHLVRADVSAPALVLGDLTAGSDCAERGPPLPVYELGSPLPRPDRVFVRDGDACDGFSLDSSIDVYSLGANVAAERFVGAEEVRAPTGERLAVRVLLADDGAREPIGAYDTVHDEPCSLPPLGSQDGLCLPERIAWSIGNFADEACTEPVAYTSSLAPGGSSDPSCPPPSIVVEPSGQQGAPSVALFEVGEPRVSEFVRDPATGACSPLASSAHLDFLVGAPIPTTAFASLTERRVGTGGLQIGYTATEQGTLLLPNGDLFDGQLGVPCSVARDCDGARRCRPILPSAAPVYADPDCDRSPLAVLSRAALGDQPPPVAVEFRSDPSCEIASASFYRLGAPSDATKLFHPVPAATGEGPGDCVELRGIGSDDAVFELGPEITVESLVALDERLE